jgi:hypothetical protein
MISTYVEEKRYFVFCTIVRVAQLVGALQPPTDISTPSFFFKKHLATIHYGANNGACYDY